jgi:seryl-tRNA synthetase
MMKFELKGKLILNRSTSAETFEALPAFQQALDGFVKDANETVLTKGAPSDSGATITQWSLDNNSVNLTISSGQYVRPHDALFRLKKQFGEVFGKEYKLGVRSVIAENYNIEFPITQKPLRDVKVPFVTKLEIDTNEMVCRINFQNLDEEFLRENYIDRIIRLIHTKLANQYYEGKGEHWEKMWSSEPRDHIGSKDPTEEMLKLGWLKQGPTKGKWYYQPQFTKILRAMEKIALDEILIPLGFQEVMQSHLVPFDIWLRTGHMEGSPNEFYYVSEPKTRDEQSWENFKDHISVTRQVPEDELKELITPPRMGICYAQCPGLYWSFQGKVLADTDLPILIYDRTANSNRYESGGRHGIERVDEFHRLEPIYIGTPEQLINLREKMIECYKHVFNDILELEWRMAWVTPWYMEQSGQLVESDGDEKIKGTIDFEAYLPYRGPRETSEWLEYQNLSIIGDKFIKAFNIKSQHGELWSGCSGIGLERWSAVFLAQKGISPADWPQTFKDAVGELPKGIKTL